MKKISRLCPPIATVQRCLINEVGKLHTSQTSATLLKMFTPTFTCVLIMMNICIKEDVRDVEKYSLVYASL